MLTKNIVYEPRLTLRALYFAFYAAVKEKYHYKEYKLQIKKL